MQCRGKIRIGFSCFYGQRNPLNGVKKKLITICITVTSLFYLSKGQVKVIIFRLEILLANCPGWPEGCRTTPSPGSLPNLGAHSGPRGLRCPGSARLPAFLKPPGLAGADLATDLLRFRRPPFLRPGPDGSLGAVLSDISSRELFIYLFPDRDPLVTSSGPFRWAKRAIALVLSRRTPSSGSKSHGANAAPATAPLRRPPHIPFR